VAINPDRCAEYLPLAFLCGLGLRPDPVLAYLLGLSAIDSIDPPRGSRRVDHDLRTGANEARRMDVGARP
jgi:hypothetical protein